MDRSREMITFQQVCSKIVESEEQLMEDLYTLIQVHTLYTIMQLWVCVYIHLLGNNRAGYFHRV